MNTCQKVKRTRCQKGFSLLELMVVIVILGLLASVTTVAVMNALMRARIDTTRVALNELQGALDIYKLRHGRYPDTGQGLAVLLSEGIVTKPPQDGWSRPLHYEHDNGKYTVTSYGDDDAPGGAEAAEDIVVTGGDNRPR